MLWAGLVLGGCTCAGNPENTPESISGWCGSEGATAALEEVTKAAGLQTWRGDWKESVELGSSQSGSGFVVRAVRWGHPWADDRAMGLWFEPDPRPEGPLPLLVNVHGHWEAGVEADEVLFRSELFARQGWAVLSVASRGAELGDADVPQWRAGHFEEGLYGEMRERRTGRSPLAWNVEAATRGLDLALEGKFSQGPIDRDRVGLIGISGGAEVASLLAANEPRVGALVLGSFEYAFGSQQGGSSCSCGSLEGGGDVAKTAAWLALGACRVAPESSLRPVLVWDGQPKAGQADVLSGLGDEVDVRRREGVHGFSHAMAASSWAFLEAQLRGTSPSAHDEDRVRVQVESSWLPIDPALRMEWPDGLPGVGLTGQGRPPWDQPFSVTVARAREGLSLGSAEEPRDPGVDWVGTLPVDAIEVLRPANPDGRAWVVVAGAGPAPEGPPEFSASGAPLGAFSRDRIGDVDPTAAFGILQSRATADPSQDSSLTRWGVERGDPPLGLAVHDALTAADRLAALPEVDPKRVGFVGIGAGGPAALWAARIRGGETPVLLSDAPVTLWWDGPRSGTPGPVRPWPTWLLAAGPGGALLDPWMAAQGLAGRVRWLHPRDGAGRAWPSGQELPGRTVEAAAEGLAP